MAAAKFKQFLAGHQGSTGRYRVLDGVGSEETVPTPPPAVRLQVHPEALRLVAYGAFWAMVLFAIAMHSLFVRGVDMDDTPLVRLFGYNNICIYWDYTPSRELTALFYPLVEFPLLAFVCRAELAPGPAELPAGRRPEVALPPVERAAAGQARPPVVVPNGLRRHRV
jgi:hypothetical protein